MSLPSSSSSSPLSSAVDPAVEQGRQRREAMARALGPVVMEAVWDPDVTEIYVNASGSLYLDTRSQGRRDSGAKLSSEQVLRFLNLAASAVPTVLNALRPMLQAELPREVFRGARLQGFVPPLASAPSFNLRKPPSVVYTLDEYVLAGSLEARHRKVLANAVRQRLNVLIAGGTGSGKTTLANALLHEMTVACPHHRIVVLEDTVELICSAEDHLALRSNDRVPLRDLLKAALRASPDRIVVGEVRDEAALELCDAWETGHPGGVATVHAEDPLGALNRLERLARRASTSSQAELVASAVDLVVMIVGGSRGRRVTEIAKVEGVAGSGFELTPIAPEEPALT